MQDQDSWGLQEEAGYTTGSQRQKSAELPRAEPGIQQWSEDGTHRQAKGRLGSK